MTRFVWSLQEGDFPLYVQSCDELCIWFQALDHTNYARWLPVHGIDMVQLAQQNPEVHAEFIKGNFVVQKSRRKFSLMAKDQAHEHSNKILQTKGGAAGLYENQEALMMFMPARVVRGHPRPTAIFNRSSRGGAQLASDVRKYIIIIFREGSRAAWQPFRCNKSGAGSTRYSECNGRFRCGITF